MHISFLISLKPPRTATTSLRTVYRRYVSSLNQSGVKSSFALCFPGQGFQSAGMLEPFQAKYPAIVNPILNEVDQVLDIPLSKYLLDSSVDSSIVNLTSNAQPMLLTTSYALFRIMEEHFKPTFSYMFGHSLGEYTAWMASGILSLKEAVWLVRKRGKAMELATVECPGPTGMSAIAIPGGKYKDILGLISNFIGQDPFKLSIANLNSTRQVVVSGSTKSIDHLTEFLTESMGQRIIVRRLPVSGPFHSPFMAPGREKMKEILDQKTIKINWPPNTKVLSNITAKPFESVDEIRNSILNTLTEPVNWLGCIEYLNDQSNVDKIVSIGPGRIGRMSIKDTIKEIIYLDTVEELEKKELEMDDS